MSMIAAGLRFFCDPGPPVGALIGSFVGVIRVLRVTVQRRLLAPSPVYVHVRPLLVSHMGA
eukprot:4291338-Pyramimonas_sp.AAC.1